MIDLNNVRPTDVPQYAVAKANGKTPAVTRTPPKVLPGASAKQQIISLGISGAALFLFAMIASKVIPDNAPFPVNLIVPIVLIGGFGVIVKIALGLKARVYKELQHGYTTVQMNFNRAHKGRWRQNTVGGNQLTWDYRGTWFLDSTGNVRRPPMFDAIAPGFYPSPTDEGVYELWTGVSWSGLTTSDVDTL